MTTKWTAQKIVDFVSEKMIEQGAPSLSADGRCLYRDPDGHKCAAGLLIPDELYTHSIEDSSWNGVGDGLKKELGLTEFTRLIQELQTCHDSTSKTKFIEGFKTNVRYLCEKQSLTIPDCIKD